MTEFILLINTIILAMVWWMAKFPYNRPPVYQIVKNHDGSVYVWKLSWRPLGNGNEGYPGWGYLRNRVVMELFVKGNRI